LGASGTTESFPQQLPELTQLRVGHVSQLELLLRGVFAGNIFDLGAQASAQVPTCLFTLGLCSSGFVGESQAPATFLGHISCCEAALTTGLMGSSCAAGF
jgi:hypothetical protein